MRALGRACQRLQGNHPRRSKSRLGLLIDIVCDAILVVAAIAFLAGLALIIWSLVGGFKAAPFVGGLALLALGPALLALWERLAWEPLGKRLSKLT